MVARSKTLDKLGKTRGSNAANSSGPHPLGIPTMISWQL